MKLTPEQEEEIRVEWNRSRVNIHDTYGKEMRDHYVLIALAPDALNFRNTYAIKKGWNQ